MLGHTVPVAISAQYSQARRHRMQTEQEQPLEITTEHLKELFRRLPSALGVLEIILLEGENARLRAQVEAMSNEHHMERVNSL